MGRLALFLFFLLCFSTHSISQTHVYGGIHDVDQKPIVQANIVLKDSLQKIHSYIYSNEKGEYQLPIKTRGNFTLQVSSLGMETYIQNLYIENFQVPIQLDVVLHPKFEVLETVHIEVSRPKYEPKQVRDTTLISVASYIDGSEFTVEQLLKKLPEIQVQPDGSITVDGKEVEKVMVENDDFFGRGYRILSKNMPSHTIKEVEILRNYSENRLLKGVEESSKIALNLKLKEEAKRVWFGSLEGTKGDNDFYGAKVNAMNFGKKNKYYFLGFSQNLGKSNAEDLQVFMSSVLKDPSKFNDRNLHNYLLRFQEPYVQEMNAHMLRFNEQHLASANAIFNPSEVLKIHPMLIYSRDRVNFYNSNLEQIYTESLSFTNHKINRLKNKNGFIFLKLHMDYDIAENQKLESTTIVEQNDVDASSLVLFNEIPTKTSLSNENSFFKQELHYTHKLTESSVVSFLADYNKKNIPQTYQSDGFPTFSLFPNLSGASSFVQYAEQEAEEVHLKAKFVHRFENTSVLETRLGHKYQNENLNSHLELIDQDNQIETPKSFFNQTHYRQNNTYLNAEYKIRVENVDFSTRLNVGYLGMHLRNQNEVSQKIHYYVEPDFNIAWNPSGIHKFILRYSYQFTPSDLVDLYDGYVLTGFQSFTKGTGVLDALRSSNGMLYYQLGDWGDKFFGILTLNYIQNHDFISSHLLVYPEGIVQEKILVKNRQMFNWDSRWDYYFDIIHSNLQVELGWSTSNFKNKVNHSELRKIQSDTFTYGVSLASNFDGFFNFTIGAKWEDKKIYSDLKYTYTDNSSYLNVNIGFHERMVLDLFSDYFLFGDIDGSNTHYFLDAKLSYQFTGDKLHLELSGKNLFNNNEFSMQRISDIGVFSTTHRLLPRRILLTAKYRF